MMGSIALGGDKPLRVELKAGSPNLLGGSVEYLLPDVGIEGLAPYLDFSAFNLSLDETTDMGFTYWSAGSRYYLADIIDMDGYFVGAGLGRFTITLTDDDWYSYDLDQSGTAEGSVGVTMLQIKLGKRFFLGPFTLGLEAGYRLEFFANTECDPTGAGEGQTYLGSTTVTTDSTGYALFSTKIIR